LSSLNKNLNLKKSWAKKKVRH